MPYEYSRLLSILFEKTDELRLILEVQPCLPEWMGDRFIITLHLITRAVLHAECSYNFPWWHHQQQRRNVPPPKPLSHYFQLLPASIFQMKHPTNCNNTYIKKTQEVYNEKYKESGEISAGLEQNNIQGNMNKNNINRKNKPNVTHLQEETRAYYNYWQRNRSLTQYTVYCRGTTPGDGNWISVRLSNQIHFKMWDLKSQLL